jgi:hypothetical protein
VRGPAVGDGRVDESCGPGRVPWRATTVLIAAASSGVTTVKVPAAQPAARTSAKKRFGLTGAVGDVVPTDRKGWRPSRGVVGVIS